MVAEVALDAWKKSPGHNAVSLIRILGIHCFLLPSRCSVYIARYESLTDIPGDCQSGQLV